MRDYREKGAGKRAQENPLPDLLRCGLKSLISFHFISIGLFRFAILIFSLEIGKARNCKG